MSRPHVPTIYPAALEPGDTIAVISPASHSKPETFAQGQQYLEALGYQVKLMPHAKAARYYLAGDDKGRLDDLHQAFADPSVKAVLCARGGYGTMRLLDGIDWDLIRANPKIFVGFSDLTAFLLPLYERTGLVGFHGPMLTSSLIENDAYTQNELWAMVTGTAGFPYTVKNHKPYQCIRSGSVSGRLMGGNITLMAALCGTPYQPNLNGAILILEDWHEKYYSLDRQWQQLKMAGVLDGVAGILFADFIEIDDLNEWEGYDLKAFFEDLTQGFNIPIGTGFSVGHDLQTATVPIGAEVNFESTTGHLEIVSSPVTVLTQAGS